MKRIIHTVVAMSFIFLVGCQEEEVSGREVETALKQPVVAEALLHWQGEYEVDGCGFFITINGRIYKPGNEDFINESFKVSSPTGTEVLISYKILDAPIEMYCGDLPQPTVTPGIKLFALEQEN